MARGFFGGLIVSFVRSYITAKGRALAKQPTMQRSRSSLTLIQPSHLDAAENEVRRCEREWQIAGAIKVTRQKLDDAFDTAQRKQREFDNAKSRASPTLELRYLRLVRLFVLSRLPGFGKTTIILGSGAVVTGISLLVSPFVFSSAGSAILGAFSIAAVSWAFLSGTILLLWPTEKKRLALQTLGQEIANRKKQMESLRPCLALSWNQYYYCRKHWKAYDRLERARHKRDELLAILASDKYRLIHSNWRILRDDGFEDFLLQVFTMLGFQAQITKKPDQGVDVLVTGKGLNLAVQAKGYHNSVANDAVQQVVAGMAYYQCTSCAVVTNSRFTPAAMRLAQATGCHMIDETRIPDLIDGRIF